MVRVALVSSPLTLEERYGAFSGAGSNQPSFALVCLCAIALREGAKPLIVDACAGGHSVEETLREIIDFAPDIVGISSTTAGIVASGELASCIKRFNHQIITVIGGCHVSALPEETLSEFPGFDAAVTGEGELTFSEILAAVRKTGAVPETLSGAAVRRKDGILLNPPRPLIENLDELPFPAWGFLRGFPGAFHPSPARIKRFPCASVVLTRGCPSRCTFCDRSVFGNRVRAFSPAYAVAMIGDLRDNYGVREILIEDDTFIISDTRVKEFCERLISGKTDITWSCLGRADHVTPELLKLMRQAGCWHISYGIESGDRDILKSVGKRLDISQIEHAVRWSREAGLRTKGFFMVGFPGETMDSLRLTRKFAMKLPLDDISVMQLTPFPGSELYKSASLFGTFDRDWRRMNILETVFVPHGFTHTDMKKARAELLRSFYFRPGIMLKKLVETVVNPRLFIYIIGSFFALLKVLMTAGKERNGQESDSGKTTETGTRNESEGCHEK